MKRTYLCDIQCRSQSLRTYAMATRGLEQIHGAIGVKETQQVFFLRWMNKKADLFCSQREITWLAYGTQAKQTKAKRSMPRNGKKVDRMLAKEGREKYSHNFGHISV